ncbi:unnamed protein product, partial [marine sediment metagenome]
DARHTIQQTVLGMNMEVCEHNNFYPGTGLIIAQG